MLQNKNIVLIGGTSGIGRSAARAFVAAGARVVAVGLDEASSQDTARELGERAVVLTADATDEQTAPEAVDACRARFGGLDALYHVAGGSGRRRGDGALHELTLDGWRYTIELNLTSLMLSNRAAVRAFLEQGRGGAILNLGSVVAEAPSPRYFGTHAYAAAKAAINGFSKSIAAYYAPYNIRVNVLAPALTETPMAQRAAGDADIQRYIKTKQPLDGGRMAQPADLDGAAVFLLSDEARFVTGQVLAVDGGWSVS
jgi:NAD(P)-dependent dehydrogenase (short-subunit alcohol dehydrogenase family)